MINTNKKAFTLVELIVVITILAILWTIWFISLQWYSSEARDSKRVTDLWQIRTGIQVYQAKEWVVPEPNDSITVWSGSTIYTIQWYAWTWTLRNIKVNDDAKDPLEENYYTYTTNWSKTKFQLLTLLENNNTAYNNVIPKTYANYETRKPYVIWDKLWTLLEPTTNTPIQELWNDIDLSVDTTEYIPVFSRDNNIKYSWSLLVENFEEVEEWTVLVNDVNPPIWWSITIEEWDTTKSTTINLIITCPTDVEWSMPIEMYISWDIISIPTWEQCSTSKSLELTSWNWTKTLSVKFRDSVGNITNNINYSITLTNSINYLNSIKTQLDCYNEGWVIINIIWDSNWTEVCRFNNSSCPNGWTFANWNSGKWKTYTGGSMSCTRTRSWTWYSHNRARLCRNQPDLSNVYYNNKEIIYLNVNSCAWGMCNSRPSKKSDTVYRTEIWDSSTNQWQWSCTGDWWTHYFKDNKWSKASNCNVYANITQIGCY